MPCSENSIGFEVKRISNLLKRRFDEEMGRGSLGEVTGVQGWLIAYLYDRREEPIFQRDIERRFGIRRSSVTGLIQPMEKNGLLERVSVPEDARLKRLILTEKGVAFHETAMRHIRSTESVLNSAFTPEELAQFLEMLHRTYRVLNEKTTPGKEEAEL